MSKEKIYKIIYTCDQCGDTLEIDDSMRFGSDRTTHWITIDLAKHEDIPDNLLRKNIYYVCSGKCAIDFIKENRKDIFRKDT